MKTKVRWIVGGTIIAALVASCGWLVLTDAPAYQFLVRLYVNWTRVLCWRTEHRLATS
ncbi:MAG TPA: hypothetical protein VET45_06785 [Candidatus Binatia bacterium]|nr:hypothetical protein [Candidatus Binatia bacterium]